MISAASSINVATINLYPDTTSTAPSEVVLVGSFDGSTWNNVATFSNLAGTWVSGTWKTLMVSSATAATTAYAFYRVIFTKTNGTSTQVNIQEMYVTTTNSRVYIDNGGVGVGTTAPRQAVDIVNANIIVNSGGIGVGTYAPLQPLHVQGSSYFSSNVGIGTALPNFLLHVAGDVNFDGSLYQGGAKYVSSQWTNVITAGTSNIYYSSNVGIGTSSPLYPLHVEGSAYMGSNLSVRGTLTATRSIATTSDSRVKTDLKEIHDADDIIRALTGYRYTRTDTGAKECGLLAQDVQKVLPEVVGEHDDLLNISYGNMACVFVEAIKTLQHRVTALENELRSRAT